MIECAHVLARQSVSFVVVLPDQEARAICPEGADLSEMYHPPGHARGVSSAAAAPLPPHSPGVCPFMTAHLTHTCAGEAILGLPSGLALLAIFIQPC
jgi:hypothetical protein